MTFLAPFFSPFRVSFPLTTHLPLSPQSSRLINILTMCCRRRFSLGWSQGSPSQEWVRGLQCYMYVIICEIQVSTLVVQSSSEGHSQILRSMNTIDCL